MLNNEDQGEINKFESDFDEQERAEIKSLLDSSVNEVATELGISEEQIQEALGPLAEIIPSVESATVTDLYNQVEEDLWEIRLQEVNTERQLDEQGLEELRFNLLDFRQSIQTDRSFLMDLTRMINAVKLRASQVDIPALDGFAQGGPSLDELQRITDGFRTNEAPTVRLRGSTINHSDDDVLQAALKKHCSAKEIINFNSN